MPDPRLGHVRLGLFALGEPPGVTPPTPPGGSNRLGLARLGPSPFRLGLPAAPPSGDIQPTPLTLSITFPAPRLSILSAAIVPTTLSLSITFPPPTLAAVETILPTHFTLPITFPPPALAPRFSAGIRPVGFKMPITFGVPEISGELTTLQVFMGGANITKYVEQTTSNVVATSQGRWTATIFCWDTTGEWVGPLLPSDPTRGTGQSVIVTEGGRRIFMGCLNQIVGNRVMSKDAVKYTLSCLDKSAICDHRIINGTYEVGTDIADIVRDIVAKSLNGEGISSTSVPASLGGVSVPQIYNFTTVTQAFNALATDGLLTWWVDVFGALQFVSIADLEQAPFELTETSNNWVDMQVTASLATYVNKTIAVSNLSASPGTVPSQSETIVLPQAKAVALGYRLGTLVLNFPANQILSFTVNGVSQPVLDGNNSIGINLDKSWNAILPGPYVFAPDSTLPTAVPPLGWPYPAVTSPFPAPGDVIVINYIPNVNNAATISGTALSPSIPGLSKCGSGVFEGVVTVQDIDTIDGLTAVAAAALTANGTVPLAITFKTFTPGLEVGQQIKAGIPKCGIPLNTQFLITQVEGDHQGDVTDRSGNPGLGHGSGYSWLIQANTGAYLGNELSVFEKLIKRSQNPLPIVQYAESTFVLAPGASLSGGLVQTNPQFVRQSGQLAEIIVQCGVPPTDQTLMLDIQCSGFGTVLEAPISIVSGDGTVHVVTVFVRDPAPTYLIVNESLTVVASYVVTGADPALAGSITVLIRWKV